MSRENLVGVMVEKQFRGVSFTGKVIRRALEEWRGLLPESVTYPDDVNFFLNYTRGDEDWYPDDLEEWFGEYASLPTAEYVTARASVAGREFRINRDRHGISSVRVQAPSKPEIQRVLNIFSDAEQSCRLPELEVPEYEPPKPVVFIGHGHSGDWRKIKDHLQDKHGYTVEAYEVGSRAGHTIRDVLSTMMAGSSFALLVMTAEDDGEGDLKRARQNVVHEAGLFQGRLGFHRAIAVVESGVEVFSNLNGVDQIRYPSEHVENTFGEILAVLRREFGDTR